MTANGAAVLVIGAAATAMTALGYGEAAPVAIVAAGLLAAALGWRLLARPDRKSVV